MAAQPRASARDRGARESPRDAMPVPSRVRSRACTGAQPGSVGKRRRRFSSFQAISTVSASPRNAKATEVATRTRRRANEFKLPVTLRDTPWPLSLARHLQPGPRPCDDAERRPHRRRPTCRRSSSRPAWRLRSSPRSRALCYDGRYTPDLARRQHTHRRANGRGICSARCTWTRALRGCVNCSSAACAKWRKACGCSRRRRRRTRRSRAGMRTRARRTSARRRALRHERR